ncbi:MAG: selenium-dependent molybdenum cofactor biosynthesis protein YqeB [Anaerolineae bacterium]|nr:selenium-dependent molybdenum cofactor biosynthesis protein YqeB [Anaerolineae bacterium]
MTVLGKTVTVVVKGGGDLASGVAWRLWNCGFQVVVTEIPAPTVIRRKVAFATAVWEGETVVDGVRGRKVEGAEGVRAAWAEGVLPVVVDPEAAIICELRPDVVVDAILAKRNLGTRITDAPLVIGLGPGFTAGEDVHAVVETMRGHTLGRVIWQGQALPNTGIPGEVGGYAEQRVVRAPCAGVFRGVREIGDMVDVGDVVAYVDNEPVRVRLKGVLRGLLHDGLTVHANMKVGDVDPRAAREHCFTISDKALAIAGGVLEAILHSMRQG